MTRSLPKLVTDHFQHSDNVWNNEFPLCRVPACSFQFISEDSKPGSIDFTVYAAEVSTKPGSIEPLKSHVLKKQSIMSR